MAKGDPNSVTVQYKVHLKPTAIGRLVIDRLARPHVDISPELRRFIELGYAAEQAGFILDGTVLRHAGRTWDTQPDFGVQTSNLAEQQVDVGRQRAQFSQPAKPMQEMTSADASDVGLIPAAETPDDAPVKTESLRGKLRGLSG